MSLKGLKRNGCLIVFLGFVAVVAFLPFQGIIWDGGFESNEYRISFTDDSGKPVSGVKLRVVTPTGGTCYFYPINEFVPDSSPTSDAEGQMMFHHASHHLEFGGREHSNLVGMKFGETDAPQYSCVFLLDDKEVHQIRYSDLRQWSRTDSKPKITRKWRSSDWLLKQYKESQDDFDPMQIKLFDCDGNGILDREELTARGYAGRDMENSEEKGEKDHTFTIVQHAFKITRP